MKTRDNSYICIKAFWVVASYFILLTKCEDLFEVSTDNLGHQKDGSGPVKDSRVLFSPRMDYEQWKPLGQVDPLKNDPTYDYAPPVLDRVHYWIDPASRKPDPPNPVENKKTEILVLGVSSKKPNTGYSTMADSRTDLFDSFLKFVDGPNLGYRGRPHYTMPQSYYSPVYYKNKPEQKEPYTMLVPPPMPDERDQNVYQQPMMSSTSTTTPAPYLMPSTSPSAVAVEEANLVYQGSSLSTAGAWKGSDAYATIAESSSHVTWKTPVEAKNNNTQKISLQFPVVKTTEKFKDSVSFSIVPSMNVVMKPMNKQNSKHMETDILVASSPSEIIHKGQVTDDTLDLTNTYVNIGKPGAHMQTASGMAVDTLTKSPMKQHILNSPLVSSVINPMITPVASHTAFRKPHLPVKKLETMPMTLQTMQTMQTMLPPPATQHFIHKKPFIHNLLKKEMTSLPILPTTTSTPPITTSASSLTTDALFKHYKQPMEPVRGPMYLIIQGHSKVKTYGPSKQINGILVQETNEIPTSDDRQTDFPVKHLHELMKDKEVREQWDREKRDFRAGRLQTLKHIVQTGLGAIDFDEANKRSDDDIKETEFVVKYDVSSGEDSTSEIYHKGIVESEIPPNRPK